MKPPLYYTDEELAIIREFYPEHGADLCDTLIESRLGYRRGARNVMQRAWKMGIQYEGERKGVFAKGQIPFNKGRKMSPEVYAAAAPTMFKKGSRPHNTRPLNDGGISIRKDKRGVPIMFIRIEVGKWVELARHSWQSFHGPIPKGHCVIFKDGNTLNCNISNLELITLAQNARRNHNPKKVAEKWNNPTDKMIHGRLQIRGIKASLEECKAEGLIDLSRAHIALNRSLSQKLKK